jgi:predicted PurR-regulated permease PerM
MTVGALYLGREFLIPLAVAGLLTFVLNPIVRVRATAARAAAVVWS